MARFYQPKKKAQLETKHQKVSVERLDHLGAGIAFVNLAGAQKKKPVFIDGTLPKETALIQLTENKTKFARAKLIKVLEPSPERIKPACSHYGECGGCNMQHIQHDAQVSYKQDALRQMIKKFSGDASKVKPLPSDELKLSAPIVGEEVGYRRKARISLFYNKKSADLSFGFRKKQSKHIVQVTNCIMLEPQLNALLPELYTLLSDFAQPVHLGHVELALGDSQPVLMLRVTKTLVEKDALALKGFAKDNKVTLYVMDDKEQPQLLEGEEPTYSETGYKMSFLPTHFIQINREVNQKMVQQAMEWLDVKESDNVLDLFCGLGNFSLPLAEKANSIVGVEGVQEMVEQATMNAKNNQITNATFVQANLEEGIDHSQWSNTQFDKVLLDPARAGANTIIDQLSDFGTKSIVYVSCNPATLARDCQSLLEQGYKMTRLGMLDMFPHTSHLESMALFQK